MDERLIKNITHQKEEDFGQILHQLEIIEKIYPYYTNMIQDHIPTESEKQTVLKSTMHKENVD